jgi:Fe-S cluster assembly scaffold protein SufB
LKWRTLLAKLQKRQIIIDEPNSRIMLDAASETNTQFALILKKNSNLSLDLTVQSDAEVSIFIDDCAESATDSSLSLSLILKQKATLSIIICTKSSRYKRVVSYTADLAGINASFSLMHLQVLSGTSHLAITGRVNHAAPETVSSIHVRGVLADTAQQAYTGTLSIPPDSFGCSAEQYAKQLLVSPRAKAVNIPILEVENRKVSCKHGSAVGHLNKEALWALESRGFSLKDGEKMLLEAFLQEPLISAFCSNRERNNIIQRLLAAYL